MKLDSRQLICHGNGGTKADTTSPEHVDDALNSSEIETGNGIMKENQYDNMCDLKSRETDPDRLEYALKSDDNRNSSKHDCSEMVNDVVCRNINEVRDFEAPEPFSDSVLYTDKSVIEHEMPKVVVYCKESTYHVLEDICVDERVPSKDKFVFDSCACEKDVYALPSPVNDTEAEVVQERFDLDLPTADSGKHSVKGREEDYVAIPDSDDHYLKVSSPTEANDHGTEKIVKLALECSRPNLSNKEVEQQSSQKQVQIATLEAASGHEESESNTEGKMLASTNVVVASEEVHFDNAESITESHSRDSAAEKSVNVSGEVSASPLISAPKTTDEDNGETLPGSHNIICTATRSSNEQDKANCTSQTQGSIEELPHNSKVEMRSISSNTDHFQNENSLRRENVDTSRTILSHFQHGLGESSFSAAVSGQIPFSGSLSMRSDSSTTSTRSFAFPILQSEWNSSPVRMAKAERRRKPKSWRHGLICCKF